MNNGQPSQGPFARELGRVLDERGMSLKEAQTALRARGTTVSLSALSYWRSGKRHPEGARSWSVVIALEEALELPEGTLSQYVPSASRKVGQPGPIDTESAASVEREALFAALGASPRDAMRILSLQEEIFVDDEGGVAAISSTLLLQCVQDTLESFAFILAVPGASAAHPVVEVASGGDVIRTHINADRSLVGFAIELDRPIGVGATSMIGLQTSFPIPALRRREHEVFLRRPIRELLQWVRFSPEFFPDWCEETESRGDVHARTTLDIHHSEALYRIRTDFGPGSLRLEWGLDHEV